MDSPDDITNSALMLRSALSETRTDIRSTMDNNLISNKWLRKAHEATSIDYNETKCEAQQLRMSLKTDVLYQLRDLQHELNLTEWMYISDKS